MFDFSALTDVEVTAGLLRLARLEPHRGADMRMVLAEAERRGLPDAPTFKALYEQCRDIFEFLED